MMTERTFVLDNAVGLHARPAAQLVRTAARFKATLRIVHGERSADARSILALLALGAGSGATITVQAEGEEREAALEVITALIARRFDEIDPG